MRHVGPSLSGGSPCCLPYVRAAPRSGWRGLCAPRGARPCALARSCCRTTRCPPRPSRSSSSRIAARAATGSRCSFRRPTSQLRSPRSTARRRWRSSTSQTPTCSTVAFRAAFPPLSREYPRCVESALRGTHWILKRHARARVSSFGRSRARPFSLIDLAFRIGNLCLGKFRHLEQQQHTCVWAFLMTGYKWDARVFVVVLGSREVGAWTNFDNSKMKRGNYEQSQVLLSQSEEASQSFENVSRRRLFEKSLSEERNELLSTASSRAAASSRERASCASVPRAGLPPRRTTPTS